LRGGSTAAANPRVNPMILAMNTYPLSYMSINVRKTYNNAMIRAEKKGIIPFFSIV
jgi:hypothetical protein